ncbi:SKP1-like protein 1 [Nicotiana tabacum]|uniref:SKP1-like protein n=1 Tax=Nicotiana tabacum TaxID=4097 RepID=A0A1S3XTM8_TOBAC|nr:PREDICTED: SKP1-like protein 4 [Nicotiana tabacum]
MATEGKKMVTLKSNDDKEFEVEEAAVIQSEMIKNMIEDGCATSVIPLPNIDSITLSKVIEYLNKHITRDEDEDEDDDKDKDKGKVAKAGEEEDLKEFDEKFVNMGWEELFDVIMAANYLNIHELMELCCQSAADRLKNKSVRAVREMLKITNDLTEEEEKEIINDAPWAFEGPEIDDTVN